MASTYLERAASGSVTSDKIFTISTWLKKGANGVQQRWFNHENEATHTQKLDLHFLATDLFRMGWWDGSSEYNLDTKRVFRDTNAWYHFVFRLDTTQATASDRVRLYVNGELQELTNIGGGTPTYPTLNKTMNLGQKKLVYGRYQAASPNHYWNGSMSHSHYCDGQSYAPTEFGEYDANGVWKIITEPSVTYGSNGHFILKDGNSVTDQSGNSNNFTVGGGTLTNTEDCPSNVFATLDALQDYYGWHDLSNGNTSVSFTGSTRYGVSLTNLGITSGKYYCEVKCVAEGSPKGLSIGTVNKQIGFGQYEYMNGNGYAYWRAGNGIVRDNAGNTEYTGNTWGTGDILMIALDLNNNNLYFGKNGTWENSGDPTSGATGTGAVTLSASPDYPFFFCCDRNDGGTPQFSWNFGNGYFQTTAVSSAGTNASGIGIFEYDVPTGYTALSTKGLNL